MWRASSGCGSCWGRARGSRGERRRAPLPRPPRSCFVPSTLALFLPGPFEMLANAAQLPFTGKGNTCSLRLGGSPAQRIKIRQQLGEWQSDVLSVCSPSPLRLSPPRCPGCCSPRCLLRRCLRCRLLPLLRRCLHSTARGGAARAPAAAARPAPPRAHSAAGASALQRRWLRSSPTPGQRADVSARRRKRQQHGVRPESTHLSRSPP